MSEEQGSRNGIAGLGINGSPNRCVLTASREVSGGWALEVAKCDIKLEITERDTQRSVVAQVLLLRLVNFFRS